MKRRILRWVITRSASMFEERYARDSGTTVMALHQRGRSVTVCFCGLKECNGWQMGHDR